MFNIDVVKRSYMNDNLMFIRKKMKKTTRKFDMAFKIWCKKMTLLPNLYL